ncbi:MAG: hypothetical protein ACUVSE_06615 [Armatimonadota bacterium]
MLDAPFSPEPCGFAVVLSLDNQFLQPKPRTQEAINHSKSMGNTCFCFLVSPISTAHGTRFQNPVTLASNDLHLLDELFHYPFPAHLPVLCLFLQYKTVHLINDYLSLTLSGKGRNFEIKPFIISTLLYALLSGRSKRKPSKAETG